MSLTQKYKSKTKEIPAFYVSQEDAKEIFIDNQRWSCPTCTEIMNDLRFEYDKRVIISNVDVEGYHLIAMVK